MANGENPINLHALIRHAQPRSAAAGPSETKLDSLLEGHARNRSLPAPSIERPIAPISPLDRLRRLFETELIPTFEELRQKYERNGVKLQLTTDNFIAGGRDIRIVIEYDGSGMRYDGTVMSNAIAFQQTRFNEQDRSGLTASGPTLRTRDLDSNTFRAFVCDRIAALVQSEVQRKA
jgi:hypothetical protein